MFSVEDEIWTNQDDLTSQIKLHFVTDPTFKDKKTNNSIMLGIQRLKSTGTYLLGGEGDNRIVYIENGMENNGFSYNTFWESKSGKIDITEMTPTRIKGNFGGVLVKKTYVNASIVTVPGEIIEIENGQFLTQF